MKNENKKNGFSVIKLVCVLLVATVAIFSVLFKLSASKKEKTSEMQTQVQQNDGSPVVSALAMTNVPAVTNQSFAVTGSVKEKFEQ